MLREIKKNSQNRLSYRGKQIEPRNIKNWIVEGDLIKVTEDGVDCTKEMLVELTFGKYLSSRLGSYKIFKDCLLYLFTEDELYDFLENGGVEMWVDKKKKGLLNEEA